MEPRIYIAFMMSCMLCGTGVFSQSNTTVVPIGALLSSHEMENIFIQAVESENMRQFFLPDGIKLAAKSTLMEANPIQAANSMCDNVIPHGVFAVIASHGRHIDRAPVTISYTCTFFHIPLIGITSRETVFSDKEIHPYFIRTVPPYSHQADIWVMITEHFRWSSVVFIHSSDPEGQAVLSRFQNKAKNTEVASVITFTPGDTIGHDIFEPLVTGKLSDNRVILLYAGTQDAERIFEEAEKLNLTGIKYAWLVTEQALKARNTPRGVLGLEFKSGSNEAAHIRDSVQVIANAVKTLYSNQAEVSPIPTTCTAGKEWDTGKEFYDALKAVSIQEGNTGAISFSAAGDRSSAQYDLVNMLGNRLKQTVGNFSKVSGVPHIDQKNIVWPGNGKEVPQAVIIKTHLRIVSIEETPFLRTRKMEPEEQECKRNKEMCQRKIDSELCKANPQEVACPLPRTKQGLEPDRRYCCYGYLVDMMYKLVNNLSISFDFYQVEDGAYGSYDVQNGSSKKEWNGMVRDLLDEKADMIIAPLTINTERLDFIDFSKPFKYQGLTILVKKIVKESSLGSFLQPFEQNLWILVGVSVHVVALVLYLLDRFSPFGQFKLAKANDTEEDALNLSTAVWFAWGVLLNSGIGEGTPRSFSARVLGMVWAGFAMIIVASYTANLAAFLVLDRPTAPISGVDDPRLRNPQDTFKYATVKSSAVEQYFKSQVELSTMYRTMEQSNVKKAEDGIKAVKEGKDLQAFIWDSSRLTYEASKDCELLTAGEMFGKSSYGIGLRKNSPWTQKVSLTILAYHEDGFMERLDNKWIMNASQIVCQETASSPATLGLTNMAGVFMMVAGGIVVGVILIFVEIAYKHYRGIKDKERELARMAANRWRSNIEKRRILRQTHVQHQMEVTFVKDDEQPLNKTTSDNNGNTNIKGETDQCSPAKRKDNGQNGINSIECKQATGKIYTISDVPV